PVRHVPQRHVQHGAIFGDIDLRPRKHPLDPSLEPSLPRQREQQSERLLGDPIFREIEQNVLESRRKLLKALGILSEQIPHVRLADFVLVCRKGLPRGRIGDAWHGRHLMKSHLQVTKPTEYRPLKPRTLLCYIPVTPPPPPHRKIITSCPTSASC